MRTFLKNWMVLKSIQDLRLLYIYSDWELNNQKIELKSIFNDIANLKVVVTYEISAGALTGLVKIQDDITLNSSWMALPANHQIQIIAKIGVEIKDDETVQTDRLLT